MPDDFSSASSEDTNETAQPADLAADLPANAEVIAQPDGVISQVGPYQVLSTLGWGGMGVVYLARDTRDQAEVALKVLRTDRDTSDESIARFQREVAAITAVHHPNIVTILDSGQSEGYHWYAMEHIHGETLDKWAQRSDLSLPDKVGLMVTVCEAMGFAHDHGIIHRDLKPANIMVTKDGTPIVTDFGLARAVNAGSSLTDSKQAVGTPIYMAPEQARGFHKDCDHRTDIWAIGVIIYELLVGVPPFAGESAVVIVAGVCEQEPPAMRVVNRSIPNALERIVMCCLRKEKHRRYATMAMLVDDLQRWLHQRSVRAPRYGVWQRLWPHVRPRVIPALLAVALVGVSMFGMWKWYDNYQHQWGRWLLVYDVDYTESLEDREQLEYYDSMFGEAAPWRRGQHGLLMERLQWGYLKDIRIPSDCRVVLQVWTPSNYNTIDVCINADLPEFRVDADPSFPIAYRSRFGWREGMLDLIAGHRSDISNSVPTHLQLGRVHELSFERDGDIFIQRVDGKVTNRAVIPMPLVGEEMDRIALRSWDIDTEILGMKVYRLAPALHASPLAAGDALVRSNQFNRALNEYLTISDAYGDTEIGTTALARALLSAAAHLGHSHERTQAIERVLQRRTSAPEMRQKALEGLIARMWTSSAYEQALQRIEALLIDNPESRIVVRCLSVRRKQVNQKYLLKLFNLSRKSRNIDVILLDDLPLTDLSALAGQPLSFVSLNRTRIDDISPVVNPSLRYLTLTRTPVESLAPLAGGQLKRLHIMYTKVSDLSPLQGHPLEDLRLDGLHVSDLSSLTDAQLTVFHCSGTDVVDLSPLQGMPIHYFRASATPLADLSPLVGMPISYVDIDSTQVSDLSPLSQSPLRFARMASTQISSLAAVDHANFVYLDVANCPIQDFGVLPDNPPVHLAYLNEGLSRDTCRDLAKRFEKVGRSDLARQARIFMAVTRRDQKWLRTLATSVGSKKIIHVPLRLNWDEAQELATSVGAQFAVLESEEIYEVAKRLSWPWASWIDRQSLQRGYNFAEGKQSTWSAVYLRRERLRLTTMRERKIDVMLMWSDN